MSNFIHELNCKYCGANFTSKRYDALYCSATCRREADKKRKRERYVWKTERPSGCLLCGAPLSKGKYRFCSDTCCRRWRAIHIEKTCEDHGELTKTCRICGKEFKTFKSRKTTCSEECQLKWHDKYSGERRYKGIKKDPDISLFKLSQRDNCQCQICGLAVNWQDYTTRDKTKICGNFYPSIDHIIPISMGGLHTWNNIQLAHRGCNSYKGNKICLN